MRLKISYIILLVCSIIQIPELFARHGGGGHGHGGHGHGGHAHHGGHGRHGYGRRGYGGYGYGGYGYGLGLAGLGLGLGYGLGYGYDAPVYNTPVVEEVVSTYPQQQTIIEQEPVAEQVESSEEII